MGIKGHLNTCSFVMNKFNLRTLQTGRFKLPWMETPHFQTRDLSAVATALGRVLHGIEGHLISGLLYPFPLENILMSMKAHQATLKFTLIVKLLYQRSLQ